MTPVLEILDSHIDKTFLNRVAKQLQAEREAVRLATLAGIPLVIGVMAHNVASSQERAQTLEQSLEHYHDGSVLEDLPHELKSKGGLKGALFGCVGTRTGGGRGRAIAGIEILKRILADRQAAVVAGLSSASGLASEKTEDLLEFLGPVVMSALGRVRREQDLDAQGVRALLVREREMIEEGVGDIGDEALWAFLSYESLEEVSSHVEQTARSLYNADQINALFAD